MTEDKRIFAFISYNHHDAKWAKWLRRKLEWYRLPSEIHNEFDDSRYIRPVFRDRDELNSGLLNDELRKRLEASKYLIVICSPHAALSQWVSDEVKTFIELGRAEYIIPFIVEGDERSFPESLKQWNIDNPSHSLLGIAVEDDGKIDKQKAFIRLVSSLLNVSFDTLWQRHKREMRMVASIVTLIATIILVFSYWFMVPISMKIAITDQHANLPGMEYGTLTVNGEEYSITHPDTTIAINPLPGYYRLRSLPISFKANRYYETEELTIAVTAGLAQNETVNIHRDSTFAIFAGVVTDGNQGVENAKVEIDGKTATTDASGNFSIAFDVDEQTQFKTVIIKHPDYQTKTREEESPSKSLGYYMYAK